MPALTPEQKKKRSYAWEKVNKASTRFSDAQKKVRDLVQAGKQGTKAYENALKRQYVTGVDYSKKLKAASKFPSNYPKRSKK